MLDPGALDQQGSGCDWSSDVCSSDLEKEMETHSSVLASRIPGTEEPGGLPSEGSHRVGQDRKSVV